MLWPETVTLVENCEGSLAAEVHAEAGHVLEMTSPSPPCPLAFTSYVDLVGELEGLAFRML